MTIIFEAITPTPNWLPEGSEALRITSAPHVGKCLCVTRNRVPDEESGEDTITIFFDVRRVDEATGDTLTVADKPVKNAGTHHSFALETEPDESYTMADWLADIKQTQIAKCLAVEANLQAAAQLI